MGFSRHEYWSGLPCPTPGDLPGIDPVSLMSPSLAVCSLPLAPPEKPQTKYGINQSNLAEYLKLIFFVAYSTNVCYIKKCINKVHTINRSSKKKQLNS